MGDRRHLLGTSAVLVGLSSALISGTATAAADSGQSDSTASAGASSSGSGQSAAPARRGPRAKAAASSAPAAASTGRGPRIQVENPVVPVRNSTSPAAAVSMPAPSAAVAADPAPEPPIPAVFAAPVTVTQTSYSTPLGRVVRNVVSSGPAAAAAPRESAVPAKVAPIQAFLNSVISALGWGPTGPAAASTPALAAFTGQRQSPEPAAVIGASLTSAAPPDPTLPGFNNGVTGVQVGHSRLEMPGAFIGKTVAADWYFPTQVDGSVDAQGVIWLQHGFGATNIFYSALAKDLAQRTNSIVVAPTLSSIPFTLSGGCLACAGSEEAAAAAFLDPNRTTLIDSALAAGYTGDVNQLKGKFAVAGHSAGGGFASAVAADYIGAGSDLQDRSLVGVVMFDGVSNAAFGDGFAKQVQTLAAAHKPIYQIAAPGQAWNAFGITTNTLVNTLPGQFVGMVLNGGSHIDSMLGVNPFFDTVLQLVAGRSPAGNTAATHLLSTGWLNDMYAGNTPDTAQFGFYAGANTPIVMGPTAAVGLPSPVANGSGLLYQVTSAVLKLFGIDIGVPTSTSNGISGVIVPPLSNGVTGLKAGSAVLNIPSGNGYAAPADWYFPTQADGTVSANGVIWLQHGFLGFKSWYADLAQALAQETNSIVVVPQINWFNAAFSGEAAAQMFVGDRGALNLSASLAGLQGPLPQKFILTGHSAGGNFATVAGAGTVDNGAAKDLLGVVMFDGVSYPEKFAAALAKLDSLSIPDYQIAARPQSWNNWGQTTDELALLHPDQFIGVMNDNGSHTDSVEGPSLFARLAAIASNILVNPSPPGAKAAVRTLAAGWVNDLYSGVYGPANPFYGFYGNPNDGTYVPDQPMVMGESGATTLPAPPPVDVNQYAGTWYEQGSVRQFFSIGLVNTKAVYTPQSDGSIKVQNSGNYFGPNGPGVNITGAAVSVNSPTNTRLNVGFGPRLPKATNPGNYWIVDYAPDYSWAIVSDPTGRSGYILTRDQTFRTDHPDAYNALVERAKQLGVTGRIVPTKQFPSASAAVLPGPAEVPASAMV
jgi:lipocalin